MAYPILGLHHVTATVDDAQAIWIFRRRPRPAVAEEDRQLRQPSRLPLLLRRRAGTPGTIWTTFPYAATVCAVGTRAWARSAVTSFSVPGGSLGFWKRRLYEAGRDVARTAPRFGEESILVEDPSGLAIELVANDRDSREPWSAAACRQGGGAGTAQRLAARAIAARKRWSS